MTYTNKYQTAAILHVSAIIDPTNPFDAGRAYLSGSCEECARHSFGLCYNCQRVEAAIIAATPSARNRCN